MPTRACLSGSAGQTPSDIGGSNAADVVGTARLDYSYLNFGKGKASAVVGGDPAGGCYGQVKSVEADLEGHVVKFGISHRF
jgi:hypothetical protein